MESVKLYSWLHEVLSQEWAVISDTGP